MLYKQLKFTRILGPTAGVALLGAAVLTGLPEDPLAKGQDVFSRTLYSMSAMVPRSDGELIREALLSVSMLWNDW